MWSFPLDFFKNCTQFSHVLNNFIYTRALEKRKKKDQYSAINFYRLTKCSDRETEGKGKRDRESGLSLGQSAVECDGNPGPATSDFLPLSRTGPWARRPLDTCVRPLQKLSRLVYHGGPETSPGKKASIQEPFGHMTPGRCSPGATEQVAGLPSPDAHCPLPLSGRIQEAWHGSNLTACCVLKQRPVNNDWPISF